MARAGESEFGGKAGLIQSADDGHVEMTAREAAFVMRRFCWGLS